VAVQSLLFLVKRGNLVKRRWIIILSLVVCIPLYFLWQNTHLVTTHYEIDVSNESLNGLRIVQLSDLHSKTFGDSQERLVSKVLDLEPDLIVLTGDMIDKNVESIDNHLNFLRNFTEEEVPVYAVSGNHEYWTNNLDEIKVIYDDLGVVFLDDESSEVTINDTTLTLFGLSDRAKHPSDTAYLNALPEGEAQTFSLLLAHRSVFFNSYSEKDYDLVLSGHAHGGMFRLPFIGGLYSPDQGLFPKLTTGPYKKEDTFLIVSRGLGNSVIPLRIMNRPEIVVVNLTYLE